MSEHAGSRENWEHFQNQGVYQNQLWGSGLRSTALSARLLRPMTTTDPLLWAFMVSEAVLKAAIVALSGTVQDRDDYRFNERQIREKNAAHPSKKWGYFIILMFVFKQCRKNRTISVQTAPLRSIPKALFSLWSYCLVKRHAPLLMMGVKPLPGRCFTGTGFKQCSTDQ